MFLHVYDLCFTRALLAGLVDVDPVEIEAGCDELTKAADMRRRRGFSPICETDLRGLGFGRQKRGKYSKEERVERSTVREALVSDEFSIHISLSLLTSGQLKTSLHGNSPFS